MSFLWLWTENDGYFNFETFQMNFEYILAIIEIYHRLICYCGRLWVEMRQKRWIDDPKPYPLRDLSLIHISTGFSVI